MILTLLLQVNLLIMGARNVAGSGLVWNNNTPVESEEES